MAKKYTPSQIAEAIECAAAHGVTAAATKLAMSRYAIHDWQTKAQRAARGEASAPTSGPAPKEIEAQRDGEILAEWKRHPGLGPSQVRNQLRRKGVKVSTRTVRRVMQDAGYRPPRVKRNRHDERFEAVRPNHMWHLDYVHRHIVPRFEREDVAVEGFGGGHGPMPLPCRSSSWRTTMDVRGTSPRGA